MARPELPLIVEPAQLHKHLGADGLLVVDLGKAESYAEGHVPGAVHLEYARLVAAQGPAMGMLPDEARLTEVFRSLGLTADTHVVAYDDECNGRAARLLWTLDAVGHPHHSLLNGGMLAWMEEGFPVSRLPATRPRSEHTAALRGQAVADKRYILEHLRDPHVVLLDTRTPEEFHGRLKRAARAGHIPGAVNFNWTEAMDTAHCLRLKPAEELRSALTALGVTPDKEIIAYCQTHHRSAHTFIVLKALGYPRVKGYPGSWSEWGNSPDTPIE
jgi:thiosulfate/3-mercaptopyruvate sulfurtransferase